MKKVGGGPDHLRRLSRVSFASATFLKEYEAVREVLVINIKKERNATTSEIYVKRNSDK